MFVGMRFSEWKSNTHLCLRQLESSYNYHMQIRAGHVAHMKWNVYTILLGKSEGKKPLED
jgi:hypothetical protein